MPEAVGAQPDYSGDPSKLHKELLEKARESKRVRQLKEKDWYISRAFYSGNQYATYLEGQGIVEQLPNPRKRPRLINNLCRVSVDTILSYLLRQDPVFSVLAKTGEPEDQNAAMMGRVVLYHYWNLLNCAEKLAACGRWALITGAGFWKVGWDAKAGPKVPQMGQVPQMPDLMNPEIQQQMAMGMMPEPEMAWKQIGPSMPAGDVRIDVVSPFELLQDIGAQTLEDSLWAIHHTMRPVGELRAEYPNAKDKILPMDPKEAAYEKQALASFGGRSTNKNYNNRCEVYEYWHRKCAEYPEGLRVVFTNDTVLDSGPTPPGYDEMPFAMWSGREVPGEFWPDGILKDALPMQKEHNKRFSQLADVANKFKTYWVAVRGTIDEEQINNEDGQIIEGDNPAMLPKPHAPPSMPESYLELMKLSREAIENVTGATAVLQGMVKGEVRSGRQVAYQGQYAEGRINLDAKNLARFLERAGRLILTQVSENVTEQRIARMSGKNRDMEVRSFKGADIRGQTDVVVSPDTLLSFSKSERFNMLNQMLTNQVITPQKFLELMDMADFSPALEDIAQDRNNAQRENEMWRNMQEVPPPRAFENHQIHLNEHNKFRKGDSYRMLDPMFQQVIDQHCAVHEQFVIGPMGAMPPGDPGSGGPPPGSEGMSGGPNPTKPPPTPAEMQAEAMKQSGQELAEGLPPVPPVADLGPENQH